MTDPHRTHIYNALERESYTLANLAATTLEQQWLPHLSTYPSQASGRLQKTVVQDDLRSMLRDSFLWIGSVTALSILVDEPGLIAEDAHWHVKMFGVQNMSHNYADWIEDLLRTYANACATVLPETTYSSVHDTIERALDIAGTQNTH